MKSRVSLLLILSLLFAVAGTLNAQNLGSIVGLVTDSSGAVVPDVEVKIVDQNTGVSRTFTANESGNYVAGALPVSKYTVEVTGKGFKHFRATDVVLNLRDVIRVDVKLEVGQITESVEVRDDVVRLQTESATVSEVVTGTQVRDISMNARNFLSLAALVPGSVSSQPSFNIPVGVSSNAGINFNGTRSSHNVWRVDGQENYDRGCGGCITVLPTPDAIAEFKVGTANTEADTGWGAGGQMSVSIKSGTKNFHGGAYEFMRNDALDATNFFANLGGSGKPHLRYNNFGYNVGGPVPFPGWKKEPKLFFFFSEDWRKLRQGQQFFAQAAPQSWRDGDFSSLLPGTQLVDSATKTAFPGNIIPRGQLDNNAKLLSDPNLILPLPTTPDGYFAKSASVPTDVREEILRVDYNISPKHLVFFRYISDNTVQNLATTMWNGSTYPTVGTMFTNPPKMYHGQWTATLGASMVNDFSYSFQKQPLNLDPTGVFKSPSGFSLAKLFKNGYEGRIPDLNFGTGFGVSYSSGGNPWKNISNTHIIRDAVSFHHGNHTITGGGLYQYFQKAQNNGGPFQGSFTFNGSSSGNAFADFMLGRAYNYSEASTQAYPNYLTKSFGVFVNDTWSVTPKLTINAGLRWDAFPHAVEENNKVSAFYPGLYDRSKAPQINRQGQIVPNTGDLLNGIAIAGTHGISRGLVDNHYNLLGPRLGLAYRPFGDKTVFRMGYGIYYERIQGNDIYGAGSNPPFVSQPQIFNTSFENPAGGSQALFPSGLTTFDGPYKLPQVMNWNVGIQRQLSQGFVLTTSYVGTKSTHLQGAMNINMPTVAEAAPVRAGTADVSQVRPYPGYSGINQYFNGVNSSYNSLQVSLRSDNYHGLTLQTSYTWSHALDYNDGDVPGHIAQDPRNWKLEYASAGFDRRHVLVINYVYQIPLFNKRTGLIKTALGGWVLSGITSLQSGSPLTPGVGGDVAGVGGTNYRPNVVGDPNRGFTKSRLEWFNTAAFGPITPGVFLGNSGRNVLVGPGTNNFDLSLFKNFVLFREANYLQFRLETYNAFNHTQFTSISTGFDSGNFGVATAARDARSIQLGLKLYF